ncbi:hypothetical protein JRI60_07710 [Archangium violaceum]|uniref:hypothetical protein n=1 Tax=Archangium violaceum TaxID=83451 RepID=UPI0019513C07|nr:hypothetical protein [Archangium violaceum]QRN98907.1 hypothetical protein JRI60_07710 [Archangium violaceum]
MHPGASFTFDDSQWPLMVVRLTGELSSQDFESYLARASHYLQRQERHVCIFDVSALRLLSTEQRQRQVEWLKAHEVLIRQTLLGIVYVVTSPVVRLTMSVIFHFKPPSAPYTIVPDLGAAGAWAAACLEKTSLRPVAERIRRQFDSGSEGDATAPLGAVLPHISPTARPWDRKREG